MYYGTTACGRAYACAAARHACTVRRHSSGPSAGAPVVRSIHQQQQELWYPCASPLADRAQLSMQLLTFLVPASVVCAGAATNPQRTPHSLLGVMCHSALGERPAAAAIHARHNTHAANPV
jgi:hypothetical protein